MRTRASRLAALVFLLVLSGCGSQMSVPIDPLPSGSGRTEFRLGEDVVAMSRGPGYRSSPAWSPDGERLAFIVDGYVVDESSSGTDERTWTTRDFEAQKIMWSGNSTILATATPSAETETATIYRSLAPDGSPQVSEAISGVTSSVSLENGSFVISLQRSEDEASSTLAVIRDGRLVRVFPQRITGEVTGISNPDDGRVALAVRLPGGETRYELRSFDLSNGTSETIYSLDAGSEVFGAPQWSEDGIYYVARVASDETASTSGRLYLLSSRGESGTAPTVGRAFTASSISLSPGGRKLAVVGRLRPNSQTNLHLLDLDNDRLRTLTSSDDMEIKNGSGDLAWSPDGAEIAFVARGSASGTEIYPGPASALLEEFYNIYRIPVP